MMQVKNNWHLYGKAWEIYTKEPKGLHDSKEKGKPTHSWLTFTARITFFLSLQFLYSRKSHHLQGEFSLKAHELAPLFVGIATA